MDSTGRAAVTLVLASVLAPTQADRDDTEAIIKTTSQLFNDMAGPMGVETQDVRDVQNLLTLIARIVRMRPQPEPAQPFDWAPLIEMQQRTHRQGRLGQ